MSDLTTVPGHIALSGHCPYCGTLQTEHCVADDFVLNGGSLDFKCAKCWGAFRVNWIGVRLDPGADTEVGVG